MSFNHPCKCNCNILTILLESLGYPCFQHPSVPQSFQTTLSGCLMLSQCYMTQVLRLWQCLPLGSPFSSALWMFLKIWIFHYLLQSVFLTLFSMAPFFNTSGSSEPIGPQLNYNHSCLHSYIFHAFSLKKSSKNFLPYKKEFMLTSCLNWNHILWFF